MFSLKASLDNKYISFMRNFSSSITKIALGGAIVGFSLLGTSAYSSSTGRHVLFATFGYMGGQPGVFIPKWSPASTDTVIMEFESKNQCESVRSELQANWRPDILNTACVAVPASAKIAR